MTGWLLMLALSPTQDADAQGLPMARAGEPLTAYMIELEMAPAARYYAQLEQSGVSAASATSATQRHLAALEHSQAAVVDAVNAGGATLLYRIQRVYNGVAVLATAEQRARFAALPGVTALHPLVSKTPATASSVPFLSAPSLWRGFDGLAPVRGEGVRIAVIDTGIDYLHVDFGGPGVGYLENNRTIIGDVPGFPSVKIIGGYDFAGDSYNADPRAYAYNPIPAPDPDPADCYSHGTHVAGIAAGYGVTQAETTYTGPWDDTLDFTALHIGPGVAPLAELYALKVFGCSGSSDIVDLAIEWAVDPNGDGDFADRVDIINMSLGSTLGDLYDTTSIAADNAASIGVIVVASAGNAGDKRFVLGSPSNADRVVSVAATRHSSSQLADGGTQRLDTIASFSSRGPRVGDAFVKPDIAAPGSGITSAANGAGSGASRLSGTSMAAPHVAGALALLRQLHPTWSSEELKALVMNTAYPLVRASAPVTATLFAPTLAGAGRVDLLAAASASAVAYAADQPGRVSFGFGMPEVLDSYRAVQRLRIVDKAGVGAAYWLSYAPLTDMTGVTVTLPITPVIVPPTGAVDALVTLDAVAASMGRATPPTPSAVIAAGRPWFDEESGHILLWPVAGLWRATLQGADLQPGAATVVATYAPSDRVLTFTLSLGEAFSATTGTIRVGAGSPGVDAALYTIESVPLTPTITGSVALYPGHELLLAANELFISVAPDEGDASIFSGRLVTQDVVLHTPLHAAPRPVAAMQATPATLSFSETLTGALTLTGHALTGSAPPTDVVSLASVYQLVVQSPNTHPPYLPPSALDHYDSADISHVGIATDFPSQGGDNAMLHFGIAAHAAWSSPNQVRFDVLLDVDGDGVSDHRLFNSSREGYNTDIFVGDSFVSVIENLRTGSRVVQEPLNGLAPSVQDMRPFASRVMMLSVRVNELDLPPGQSVISYTVESYHRALGTKPEDLIDRTPPRRFDLAHPALDGIGHAQALPLVDDRPGVTLTPALDSTGWVQQAPGGILILHHQNAIEQQVEVIPVSYSMPNQLFLPTIAR
jgi:subtilisin family serine protease